MATDPKPTIDYTDLLWVTNHPRSLKGMWPRRVGVTYIEGPPKATTEHTVGDLEFLKIVGAYVDMPEESYRELPVARTPQEMPKNQPVGEEDKFWMTCRGSTKRAPKKRHTSLTTAITEAGRLAALYAGEPVFILEPIGVLMVEKKAEDETCTTAQSG